MRIKKSNTYELINSEGPILIFELTSFCGIFIFPQEISSKRVPLEDIIEYLEGGKDIISPFGKIYNLSKTGQFKDMIIYRNINFIKNQLS
jgi:hypothetical protein